MAVRESEYRMAITQALGCQGGRLLEVVEVARGRSSGARESVHVFALHGRKGAERCFVWSHPLGEAIMRFQVVPQSPQVQTAEQAVRSVSLPRRKRSAI